MSGRTPRHAFTVQLGAPYENYGIKVDQAVIDAIHAQIPVVWAHSMCWVDDRFEKAREDTYNEVGWPALLMTIGWSVFSSMAQLIRLEY